MEGYRLPKDWEWKRLGDRDYFDLIMGQSPPSDTYNLNGEGLPFFQGKAEFGALHPVAKKYCTSPTRIAHKDDVLISVRAPVGPTNIADQECCVGRGLAAIRCTQDVLPRYLLYALRNIENEIATMVRDQGAGFTAIKKHQLAAIEIPLPPLAEQRRIVSRIEEIASRVSEVSHLQEEASHVSSAIFPAALSLAVDGIARERKPLAEVLSLRPRNGWSPRCDDRPEGTPVLALSAVTGFQYDGSKFKRTSAKTNPQAHYWLDPSDLLITRSNTLDLVGHAAIYDGTPYPCIYSDLMMKTRVDVNRADVRFVHLWLMGNEAREHIKARAQGTSASMKKISQGDILELPFPDIHVWEQRRVVDYLDSIHTSAEELKRQQQATHLELDKVIPSLLSKAFRGEL